MKVINAQILRKWIFKQDIQVINQDQSELAFLHAIKHY